MNDVSTFTVSYDRRADTLYIVQPLEAARGVQDRCGIIWRYNSRGEIVGATVMDFREIWAANPHDLAVRIADKFNLPIPQAAIIIDQALGIHSTH